MKIYLNDFSNAPLRVRIAVALKKLEVEEVHLDLEHNDWRRNCPEFAAINPQEMLPVLVDGRHTIHQSLAIIEYLEEKKPFPSLLPADPAGRARVRSLALMIACDGQPLLNLRVRKYMASALSAQHVEMWFKHWMNLSLKEYEALLARDTVAGRYSHGDSPTIADVCLIPQMLMAQRFIIPTKSFRRATRVFDACMELPEFAAVASATAIILNG